jgi:electron transfer flavoprotein beta subunit
VANKLDIDMKIVVCIKQICYTYARSGMDPGRNFLAPEDKIYRINPCDETALELALRIMDFHANSEVILVTLGGLIAEDELRRCLAMGADHLFQIKMEDSRDSWAKSLALAQAAKSLAADLVLCGKESADCQNGQVGAFLAHHLKMPFVSAITDIAVSDNDLTANVQRSSDRGMREEIACLLPAVFSVNAGSVEPRLPTYEGRKNADAYTIQELACTGDRTMPKLISEKIYPPRPRPKKVSAPDNQLEAYQRIKQLLTGSRVEKTGTLLDGSPQSQVDGIIAFLEKHGFIESKQSREKD